MMVSLACIVFVAYAAHSVAMGVSVCCGVNKSVEKGVKK